MYGKFMNILLFILCKICCLFVLLESAWFEASVEYSKYVIDEMCRLCNFSWTACWIRLWLFWTFISPGATVIDVTVIFGVFFVVLESDLSCSFDGASSEFGRKIKHLQTNKYIDKKYIVRIVHAHTHPEQSSRFRSLRHRRFHNGYYWWRNMRFHNGF